MSGGELAFLGLVITAALCFVAVLAWVSFESPQRG